VHRVCVIGCGGAGKTTLARALAARLELPAVHLDALRDRAGDRLQGEESRCAHERVIREERWVIDGMRFDTLEARLASADTAIYLDLPARSCYAGIVRRRIAHRGGATTRSAASSTESPGSSCAGCGCSAAVTGRESWRSSGDMRQRPASSSSAAAPRRGAFLDSPRT
jgi:adenylate kinase family enzyme